MTPRRVVTATLAFLGLIGVLLIPSPSGAATRTPRFPRATTTTVAIAVAVDGADPAPAVVDDAPLAVTADAPFPAFTFPVFTFPGFPALDALFASIQQLLSSLFNSLCGFLPIFCSS
jgi:hypothetical protein